ncbi:MAG: arginyltransferase [Sneathiellales bacterium]|nr:arginyltransferase [Sneathiellales bacterium]
MERKIVTLLAGEDPDHLHNALSLAGFRRSQDLAYRPACEGCNACIPIRVNTRGFEASRSQRRIWSKNRTLKAVEKPALASSEHFELFRKYLNSRHADGGMADMNYSDYQAMVEDSPVKSVLVEFRHDDGTLFAVCLTDQMDDGLSLVYSFYDPDEEKRSPGSFIILWHILQARYLAMPYVYLGYWIAESPKMAYKKRFQPVEILTKEGWQKLNK